MRLRSEILRCASLSWRLFILAAMTGATLFPATMWAQGESTNTGEAPAAQVDEPTANPGRPTVSTPATLTPVGYFQVETGLLAAWHSPEFSRQTSWGEVVKLSVSQRIELIAATDLFVHSDTDPANGTGGVALGVQGVVHPGEGAHPTVALTYFRQVFNGGTPDLDVGSATNSGALLVSADVRKFHYDTNYLFNEVVSDPGVRRAQFGQTLSVSHGLRGNFGITGEIWHFTQPFLRSNAVGNLWALNDNVRKNLVLDVGLNRGLTGTSTRWEILTGFTYLLPHAVHLR